MRKRCLKVLALSGILALGVVGVTSCAQTDTQVETQEGGETLTNMVLSGAKDLAVGDTLTLTVHFEDGKTHDVIWASTNQNVANVDQNGLITALDTGRTTIVCQLAGVSELVKAEVTINVKLAGDVAPEYVKATFVDYDGSVLYEDIVEYGGTPSFGVKNPSRINDSENSYAFAGWDKDLGPITENTTYTAVYETIPLSDFAFEVDVANGGYRVSGYNGSSTDVVIPATFSYRNVVSVGEEAFAGMASITSVTLPETIVEIGANAFNGCSALKSINLPLGLKKLGEGSFYQCIELSSPLVIGPEVSEIPLNCFYYCQKIPSISGNEGVKVIGDSAFTNCSSLVFEFKEGLESIGRFAFQWNRVMTTISLPDSVTYLGESVFCHCQNLVSLKLPRNLETIFWADEVSGYQQLTLGCTNLSEISIADDAPNFMVDNNEALYSKDGKMLYFVIATRFGDYEILDTCEEIGPTAFYGVYVDTLTIPGSVKKIDYNAFWTSEVENIVFEESEAEDKDIVFGKEPFASCENLKTVVINRSLTSLPNYFLRSATELYSVTLPDTLETLGNYAFQYCERLVSINLPDSLTTLGTYAFYETAIVSMTVPSGVTEIGAYTFYNCPNLMTVNLPDTVTEIGHYAFAYDSNLRSISLPSSLESIGNYVFRETGITSIVLPDSLTSMGTNDFYGTDSLKSVTIGTGMTELENYTFRYSGIESIVIPDNITKIGTYVFDGCEALKSVDLSKSLSGNSAIGNYSFQNCSALETLTFGPGLSDTELGNWSLKFGTNALKGVEPKVINFRGSEEAFKKVDFNNAAFEEYLESGEVTINYNYEMETEVTPPETLENI